MGKSSRNDNILAYAIFLKFIFSSYYILGAAFAISKSVQWFYEIIVRLGKEKVRVYSDFFYAPNH
jgi:hypothetical protein